MLGIEPIKSGSVHLRPLHYINSRVKKAPPRTQHESTGILEERGESACSSHKPKNFLSSEGTKTSLYPRLKDTSAPENRNSCDALETVNQKS